MHSFTFIHAADLHLDTPFAGVGPVPAGIREALRDASLAAFDRLIELTIAEQAAFLLLSGDLYDGPARGLRAQRRLLAGLERLSARGVRVFIIHGERDQPDGWTTIDRWPAGVTIFDAASVGKATVERDGQRLATIQGISYDRLHITERPTLHFHRHDAPGAGIAIGMLHTPLGEQARQNGFTPCTVDDLRARGLDYWALGQAHEARVIQDRSPAIVYPGTLQGRSAEPGERGPKGAMVVRVEAGVIQPPRFVPLDAARYVDIELDVTGLPDRAALRQALQVRAAELRGRQAGPNLLLSATLRGSGSVHRELIAPEALDELLRELRLATSSVEGIGAPFVWWAGIRDWASPPRVRDEIRRRGDFSAEILRFAEALAADPAARRTFAEARPPEARSEALDILGPEPHGRDLMELLRDAETLALDLLEEWDKS